MCTYARIQERRKKDGEEKGVVREGEERENMGERESSPRNRINFHREERKKESGI